jgi:hypothetical protein
MTRSPIFIVGAPYSGINALTWAVASQGGCVGVSDGRVREALVELATAADRFTTAAQRTAAQVSGVGSRRVGNERARLRELRAAIHAGAAASLSGTARLVVGDPALSPYIEALAALFPDAVFVHLVREVRLVVAAAAGNALPAEARLLSRVWLEHVRSALEAECTLGPARVIRVTRADFAANPARALRALTRRLRLPASDAGVAAAHLLVPGPPASSLSAAHRAALDPDALRFSRRLATGVSAAEVLPRRPRATAATNEATRSVSSRRVHQAVTALPPGAVVVVISKGDPAMVDFDAHTGWHYPRSADGTYTGYHPADSAAAVEGLEAAVAAGASYFVVPEPFRWYLAHYDGLRHWLFERAQLAGAEHGALVFRLREDTPGTAALVPTVTQPADTSEPDLGPALEPGARLAPRQDRRTLRGSLWAMTAYYNPARYANKSAHYRLFRARLAAQGVPLLAIEVAFGDQSFELRPSDADRVVQLRGRDILWQKERILNQALRFLPADCDKVAWLDADVLFSRASWADDTSALLDQHVVVQPFSHSVRLPPHLLLADPCVMPFGHDDARMMHGMGYGVATKGRAALDRFLSHGHSGYAWAARRSLLERHGLYDANLLGNGDADVAYAMYRCATYWSLQRLGPAAQAHLARWAGPFGRAVNGSVGFVPGVVFHLWHGSMKHRLYDRPLDVLHDFDPDTDLVVNPESGLYEWAAASDRLRAWSREYFAMRREDGRE